MNPFVLAGFAARLFMIAWGAIQEDKEIDEAELDTALDVQEIELKVAVDRLKKHRKPPAP